MSPAADDWRRTGQEEYMLRATMVLRPYAPYREDWDHDHCEFCGAKFSRQEADLHEGYATEDNYRWVCPTCFSDFQQEFGWTIRISPGAG